MPEIRLHLQQADGRLPAVCMCCGQAATVTTTKKMQWCPPWVGVLILTGLLPYLIVASILTRRATLQAPMCEEHKKHWFTRSLVMWGSLLLFLALGIGGVILGSNLPNQQRDTVMPIVCVGSAVMGVVWLIIVIWAQNTGIRPKEITDEEIMLTGVAAEFVDAVETEEQERRERRAAKRRERDRWRDEEEEDDRPRRRRASSDDDRFEES